jgi:hypothetical protein
MTERVTVAVLHRIGGVVKGSHRRESVPLTPSHAAARRTHLNASHGIHLPYHHQVVQWGTRVFATASRSTRGCERNSTHSVTGARLLSPPCSRGCMGNTAAARRAHCAPRNVVHHAWGSALACGTRQQARAAAPPQLPRCECVAAPRRAAGGRAAAQRTAAAARAAGCCARC